VTPLSARTAAAPVRLGLGENLGQFSLLVLINAFVGGMVGLERTIVPLVGSEEFHIGSEVVVFSFIIAFGVIKALLNLASGPLADRFTRKMVLVAGWIVGLPVPFMLAWGPSWAWIVAANVLLGISQGLAWSMTVNMKIDLVGPARRGLAMGLNEAAGYGALGATALLTGYLAASYGLRPEPFYIGILYAVLGLGLSVFLVRDTRGHAQLEAAAHGSSSQQPAPSTAQVFVETSWRNRTLFSVSQAGLVNNLNDGMSWGVFPLLFVGNGVTLEGVGLIKAIYPGVWGVGQIFTGLLADRLGRKPLIVWGMVVQAAGHAVIGLGLAAPFLTGLVGSVLLGAGTAMVYPALLAAVGDVAHPGWRATSVGVYRFWRDLGYAVGALMAGVVAAMFGLVWAVHVAGLLTLLSGLVAWAGMSETLPMPKRARPKHTHEGMMTKQIETHTLRDWLDTQRPVTVLDIRTDEDRAQWAIPESMHVNVYDALRNGQAGALADLTIPTDRPVITVCNAGKVSQTAADLLASRGFDARSLEGGMKAWSLAWNVADVPLADASISVVQVRRTGKGCLSYILASQGDAVVIDPSVAPDVYLEIARERGWSIRFVLETHLHADHLSRGRELARVAAAVLMLPPQNRARFAFTSLADGEQVRVGDATLQAVHTPGHTDESTSYLLNNAAVFTGDTLFTSGVGRPDLHAEADAARARARSLFASLGHLRALPAEIVVLPAHASEPIPFDRRPVAARMGDINRWLADWLASESAFVDRVTSNLPPTPPNFVRIVDLNETGDFPAGDPTELEAGANRCAVR
jgi:glyoxylase-like metal-dependent hydrolase (beta-lactamase superfamily II)/MFS family permease